MKTKKKLMLPTQLGIKSKFLLMLLAVALLCITVIGYQGIRHGRESLTQSIYDQLIGLRATRAQQVEEYLQSKRNEVATLADNLMIVAAMKDFSAAFALLNAYKVDTDEAQKQTLNNFYQQDFLTRLAKHTLETPELEGYFPNTPETRYLQYHYIAANTYPTGSKQVLTRAEDGSYFSEVHKEFHESLRLIVEKLGFYDLFLIDHRSGSIVYTVFKEADFATNILKGPYYQSGLAMLTQKILQVPKKGSVLLEDFNYYAPSYGSPAAFFATPIYKEHELIGVLAAQISVEQINTIMSGGQQWQQDGLGASGEVYLVGEDLQMRSNSRFLIEDKEAYLQNLSANKLEANTIAAISKLNTSILTQPVTTTASRAALNGESGSKVTYNYQNTQVLSTYAPLQIADLNWGIVAEKSMTEIDQPVLEFEHKLVLTACLLAACITLLAMYFASRFVRPIRQLDEAAKAIGQGQSDVVIHLDRSDEFGSLSDSLECIEDRLVEQEQVIQQQAKENQKLLLNVLPESLAKRHQTGEEKIADHYTNVAVLCLSVRGLFKTTDGSNQAVESAQLLNELIALFDVTTQKYGLETIRTSSTHYLAECGLHNPRLDAARRCADCAIEYFDVIRDFNQRYQQSIDVCIGVDSGDVMAGVLGEQYFSYDIWGIPVSVVERISRDGRYGTLRVTQSVHRQLTDNKGFQSSGKLSFLHLGQIEIWERHFLEIQSEVADSEQQGQA